MWGRASPTPRRNVLRGCSARVGVADPAAGRLAIGVLTGLPLATGAALPATGAVRRWSARRLRGGPPGGPPGDFRGPGGGPGGPPPGDFNRPGGHDWRPPFSPRDNDWRGRFHGAPWGDGLPPWGWGAPPPPIWDGPLPEAWGPPPPPINYFGFNEQPVWDPGYNQWGFYFFGIWIPLPV